jgi:hypothetical protein
VKINFKILPQKLDRVFKVFPELSYPFFPLSFTPYFFLFILYVYQYLQMAVFLALAFPGVSLLVYQLSVYPHTNKILGPIKTSRVAAVSKNW